MSQLVFNLQRHAESAAATLRVPLRVRAGFGSFLLASLHGNARCRGARKFIREHLEKRSLDSMMREVLAASRSLVGDKRRTAPRWCISTVFTAVKSTPFLAVLAIGNWPDKATKLVYKNIRRK